MLQVLLAVMVVIILFVIGFMVYGSDMVRAIRESGKTRMSTTVFKGIKDLSASPGEIYQTVDPDPLDPTYLNLGNSINQPSGVEMTYNFWLYINTPTPSIAKTNGSTKILPSAKTDYGLDTDNIILFLRGDNKVATYNSLCSSADDTFSQKTVTKQDIKVKCPLVKLENNGNGAIADVLTVEFNTVTSPDVVQENARNTCGDTSSDWNYMNSYKLSVPGLSTNTTMAGKWNMITIVIQETYPDDPLPMRNKARCRIYVNGGVELDKYVDGKFDSDHALKSILKENQGNFYLFPQIPFKPIVNGNPGDSVTTVGSSASSATHKLGATTTSPPQLAMADLTYFNYAMPITDIAALFKSGFTQSYAPVIGATPKTPGADPNAWMKKISANTKSNKTVALV